ncbi:hypothetical protein D3Z51_02270 [Clostridiaceae bacterium]|nr:hypothetical protein [Clostridiaceae bacterium]RKI18348.1 hypothetical protein D7V81_00400 [bacterium 1XD21-70]
MKVTDKSWSSDASRTIYEPAVTRENNKDTKKAAASQAKDPDMDLLSESLKALSKPASKENNSNFKMKSKTDDSVGQLASMLARAETRIDVQQVASRAIRALANLKMAAFSSEGSEAKKIARMIKRMEKLMKRIQKKLQHLSKEEQLENQKKKAEKNMEEQKVEQIKEELNTRRKKRRKDERNYANKELAEDAKTASQELVSSMSGALSPSSSPSVSVPDMSGFSGDAGIADSVSIDISV